MDFANSSAAFHWCWVIADQYEQQIFIGVLAVTQACCQPVLQSSTEKGAWTLPKAVLQCIGVGSLQTIMNCKSSQVYWHSHKLAVSLFCRAALSSGEGTWPTAVLQCYGVGSLQTCMNSKSSKVYWHSNKPVVSLFFMAALRKGNGLCQQQYCSSLVLGHCRPV